MSRPLVKVIVPCYGYADQLGDCLRTVLNQEGVDLQVLILDDCSPDETPEVARRIMVGDDRIEYRRHRQNAGLIATANEGLSWADDGDFVILLSADDMLVPGSLKRAVRVMEAEPAVGLVYGHAQYFESPEALPSVSKRWRGTKVWSGREWIRLRCRSGHNCISSPEAVVRTSVQRLVGGYDPACQHSSDLNMWLRIAAVSDVAYIRGAVQALYRIHSDSMFRGAMHPVLDLTERRAAFFGFFDGAGTQIAETPRWRSMVGRALARQALWQASRAYDRDHLEGADAVPVDKLIDFALQTCDRTRSLPEWWGLRLRRRIGAGRSQWFPPFIATGAGHRLRGHASRLRWRTTGI